MTKWNLYQEYKFCLQSQNQLIKYTILTKLKKNYMIISIGTFDKNPIPVHDKIPKQIKIKGNFLNLIKGIY